MTVVASTLEKAADLIEAEGYCRSVYETDSGRHCQVGALNKLDTGHSALGGTVVLAALSALHPYVVPPTMAADPRFQLRCYGRVNDGAQQRVVRHMRETAARLQAEDMAWSAQDAREPAMA